MSLDLTRPWMRIYTPAEALVDLQTQITDLGSNALQLANTAPPAVAGASVIGAGARAARNDHTHDRITAAANGLITDANGIATFNFGRAFAAKPNVIPVLEEAAAQPPVTLKITGYIQDGSLNYIGAFIEAQRFRTLPTITPLNGGIIVLLASLITALNSILAAISQFAVYQPVQGVSIQAIAIPVTV